jgi:alpha-amylase/alpha-mannosidase (GH57 family)
MVKLAILWHMHQPNYEDVATGEHILPWVRLHAIKDYVGMVELLEEFPGIRVTFNLVPSLLVQLQAFAEERARDRHLEIGLKPVEALDADERAFLIANGFHASEPRMIRPYARYAELYARRANVASFSIEDLRDLQVWHKLAWMDADWLQRDPRLAALVKKGRLFTENDKLVLREVELELVRRVIPLYAAAAAREQVELSTSPFYHPILPLLCDTDVHLRAHPHSALPRALFRWPDDGRDQLARAIRLHAQLFGNPPRGIWPSEGSVSDAAVRLIADTGVTWIATDEGILARSLDRSLSPEALYRPYEVGEPAKPLRCLFRDHGLSDLIGFSYQSWDAEAAAEDFIRRVQDAGRRFADGGTNGDATVSVILDGENAWEHYPGGGRPFLRALYRQLQRSPEVRTVTMSEAAAGPARRLESLFPGSWINSDFYIWAGHPDDHRAWAQLAAARRAYDAHAAPAAAPDRDRAFEELTIAEGSDWFWWYGDDHSSDHDREFDELFRRHVRNVYRALQLPVPDALYASNISTAASGGPLRPRAFISPVIDGEVTGFAEWSAAVPAVLGAGGGTMHRVASELVQSLMLGVSRSEVFIRIDGASLVEGLAAGTLGLAILIGGAQPRRVELVPHPNGDGVRVAVARVIEAALGFNAFDARPGDRLTLTLLVTDRAGHVVEQHPSAAAIEIEVPAADLEAVNWSV